MGCNDSNNNDKQTRVVRDTTITTANAYAEIFLDSVLLEDFIAKEVKTDSIAHYMRNFYNSRNYSFAWFDDKGLTVQANGFWNAHDREVLQTSDSGI